MHPLSLNTTLQLASTLSTLITTPTPVLQSNASDYRGSYEDFLYTSGRDSLALPSSNAREFEWPKKSASRRSDFNRRSSHDDDDHSAVGSPDNLNLEQATAGNRRSVNDHWTDWFFGATAKEDKERLKKRRKGGKKRRKKGKGKRRNKKKQDEPDWDGQYLAESSRIMYKPIDDTLTPQRLPYDPRDPRLSYLPPPVQSADYPLYRPTSPRPQGGYPYLPQQAAGSRPLDGYPYLPQQPPTKSPYPTYDEFDVAQLPYGPITPGPFMKLKVRKST